MATKKRATRSGLTKALLETAAGMRNSGLLDRSTYDKITLRHLGPGDVPRAAPMSGRQIRALRERARMSQAVFARHLNLTVGYVSQLERGAKQPTGATLALLNVIRRKGIETIL
jgi:putative transcriptional regulator